VYIGVNRHLADNFNLTQDAFIGQEVGFLKGSAKLADFLNQFVNSPSTSAEAVLDVDLVNGKRYYLVVAHKNQQGSTTVSVGIDITDRKLAEESLRIAEEGYRSIFENALEGIFQSSPEGKFIKANPALAKIYGYDSPAEMMASITNIGEQLYVDPEKRVEFRERLHNQDSVKDFEYRCYCKDGSIIWTQIDARVIKDSEGKVLYYEGLVQDITAR
jgi:PAS domain S-box-containing protein